MPHAFRWDGTAMLPLRPKLADDEFIIGEVYLLEVEQQRNMAQHRAYFANIRQMWMTLPENLQDEFPSPESLRARALLDAGYCTTRQIDAGSKAGAERVAAYVRGEKPFAGIVTRGTVVVVREPESQSVKAMGPERFRASMDAVLGVIAALIGVTPEAARREAGGAR
jgi:hypothetical protein